MNEKKLIKDLEKAGYSGEKINELGLADIPKIFKILAQNDALDAITIHEHTEEYTDRIAEHKEIMDRIRKENSNFSFNKNKS